MRLSVEPNDAGYAAWAGDPPRWRTARILLNGVPIRQVITADTEAGFIRRCQTDENGKIVFDQSRDEIPTEDLFGEVRIEEGDDG